MRVPASLPECFEILDAVVDEETKEQLKTCEKDRIEEFHFNLGLYMRNNWLYDRSSPLVIYFHLIGLNWKREDDVSTLLIDLYRQYLNGASFTEDQFIEEFKKNVPPASSPFS